jgi:hypothetical protein
MNMPRIMAWFRGCESQIPWVPSAHYGGGLLLFAFQPELDQPTDGFWPG